MLKKIKNWFIKGDTNDVQSVPHRPLNTIGFFQFDNLIQNRVPFVLYNLGPDLKDHYQSIYKVHLEKHQILATQESALVDIKQKNHALSTAIILICQDGTNSTALYFELEKVGYTNVYVLNGGYQQMMTEMGST